MSESISGNTADSKVAEVAALLLKPLFENRIPEPVPVTFLPSSPILRTFIFYYFQKTLTAEQSAELRNSYSRFLVSEMRRKSAFQKVGQLLTDAGITFYPLKGCRLAYSYYPDPVLRYSVDVDILTAPEDAGKAFELIAANGWTPKHDFRNFEEKHLPELHNRKLCTVEIHTYIFEKDPEKNRRLFEMLQEDPESPELLLANLMHHAFHHHNWQNAMKTVIDIGMILRKGGIDPEKYRKIAACYGVEQLLESVLTSFPEFFPARWLEMFPARHLTGETIMAIRALALGSEGMLEEYSAAQLAVIAGDSGKSVFKTVYAQLRLLSPSRLGITYGISCSRARISYPFLLIHYLFTRSFSVFSLLKKKRDPKSQLLKDICSNLEKLKVASKQ